jgi:uncharacterized protein YpmB
MTLSFAIGIYFAIVAVVSSILTYYFKVMRPNEESELRGK